MKVAERFKGCILCGAIGDAYGSSFEGIDHSNDEDTFYLFKQETESQLKWTITDDTQMTLATCDAIIENKELTTNVFAQKYLDYFRQRKISGIGASTLKALQELDAGGHWSIVGRKGEFAAGNGAAMRIAPVAFINNFTRKQVREISTITHNNDEAYVGALTVWLAIKLILDNRWTGKEDLITLLISQIPDTKLRDRLTAVKKISRIKDVGELGHSGYVVDSVPLAIAAANKVNDIGIEEMFIQLIEIGGDTDTNCSIAGQIAGALVGSKEIPLDLINNLKKLDEYGWINDTIDRFTEKINWN